MSRIVRRRSPVGTGQRAHQSVVMATAKGTPKISPCTGGHTRSKNRRATTGGEGLSAVELG